MGICSRATASHLQPPRVIAADTRLLGCACHHLHLLPGQRVALACQLKQLNGLALAHARTRMLGRTATCAHGRASACARVHKCVCTCSPAYAHSRATRRIRCAMATVPQPPALAAVWSSSCHDSCLPSAKKLRFCACNACSVAREKLVATLKWPATWRRALDASVSSGWYAFCGAPASRKLSLISPSSSR